MSKMCERIKKVLENKARGNGFTNLIYAHQFPDIAREVCQLFPKSADNPDGHEVESPFSLNTKGQWELKSKLGESGLLTKEEIFAVTYGYEPTVEQIEGGLSSYFSPVSEKIAKEQDVKTAAIKDAEYQTRVEKLFEEIDDHFKLVGYRSEEEYNWWQSLKNKRGLVRC